jgi:hypothetical protein
VTTSVAIHVAFSLIGIVSGVAVVAGLLTGRRLDVTTAVFLLTTVATSAGGFLLPADRILPSHIVAVISLMLLVPAIYARYARGMAGRWRTVYVVGAVLSLYLNVFVGIVQAFQKIPALRAAAPTQSELPFQVVQLAALAIFVGLTIGAVRGPVVYVPNR